MNTSTIPWSLLMVVAVVAIIGLPEIIREWRRRK